jgi:hypothetical protein
LVSVDFSSRDALADHQERVEKLLHAHRKKVPLTLDGMRKAR